jgi:molybdopterin molybdotransferase
MITIEQASALIFSHLPEGKKEEVRLRDAAGRVLAQSVVAGADVPPFRRSAMDGYAVRAADVANAPARLRRVGESRAGVLPSRGVGSGEAMVIYTGAAVPDGADAVQMVEETRRLEDLDEVLILKPVHTGENIAPVGNEARAGETILELGRVIGPRELAVLATFGCSRVSVWTRPSVALLATGDELVEVDQTPAAGQIRNSNVWSLTGQLRGLGIHPDYLGIARDDAGHLRKLISEGLRRDVLILTGGVSMGEYDLVKGVLDELGVQIHFTRVAMKPGKPTVFATRDRQLVFGLPGNPVSTFVAFENFVRPAVGRICGIARPELPRILGTLMREMKQSPGRTAFLPASVSISGGRWEVEPLRWRGSGDIIGFSHGNAAVIFPGDRNHMAQGETVEVMLFPDFFHRGR